MTDRKKDKQTARELIGEHMDLMLRMDLESEEKLPDLIEERALIQSKMKDKANSIDYFSVNI